jgi:hypothetical protein
MTEAQTKQRFVVRRFGTDRRWGVYDTETMTFPLSRPGYGKVAQANSFGTEVAARGEANLLSAFYGIAPVY